MIVNGIDLSALDPHKITDITFPDKVPGRIVSIDADFLAYMMSYVREGDHKTWDDMKHNCEVFVKLIQSLAGATGVHLHLTPSTSNKGFRPQIAQLKEYQANRDGKDKPEHLHVMREWMYKAFPATLHQSCEADDGMAEMQYKALAEGNGHLHMIASKDKDLDMVPGLHLDWDTGSHKEHGVFGELDMQVTEKTNSEGKVTRTKKLKGYGQVFFWAQMLMGDTADNVSGLPALSVAMRDKYDMLPESAVVLKTKMNQSGDGMQKIKYDAALSKLKPSMMGAVGAYDLLHDVRSHKEAGNIVMDCYRNYDGEFKHWKTGSVITWQQAFLSEAALLWMRRNKEDPADVKKWIAEVLG